MAADLAFNGGIVVGVGLETARYFERPEVSGANRTGFVFERFL